MNANIYGQTPENEKQRLKELRSYDILDSLHEKDYDDIVTLASIICDVPMALISFVDKDRQWFKATHGLDGEETHRQHSFCSHAILSPNETMIVPDSRLDDRFKDNPFVVGEPNVVFYAGVPLVSENGYGLGSFCVIDRKPRELSEDQLKAMKILAGQVMKLLELRKTNVELNLKKELLELKAQNLDGIVSARIAQIEGQKVQLEKTNKELQAFNYISSHDLQEPLRKIQTFTSLIAEREFDNLSEKGKEYFLKIGKASSRMSHLIKDLLAYSRTTLDKKNFTEISLQAVVNDVLHDLEEDIKQRNAQITLTADAHFNAIAFQFRQVIYNLLSNSLKFSRADTIPEIIIDYRLETRLESGITGAREKTYHYISVKDNGIGFENKYSEKIFELFQRLETKDLQIGTGIGLAIVKKIIDNHKGYIFVESAPDEGTEFKILIPV
ncbi:GAF domain-containing protein [Flavobacterium sp. Sd200]|uniref:GAF domain-containing sensor histidine kinase n=1 Tax=Flavobacterium sp. Sd200 TaxID=2692211 RepID=UPI00136F195C|nr:ATP-binding protein [Flavobacterium sp. Sd200]MXN92168.1 GAF domain-containing protein [Flavobacterium sp. Sd200]